MCLLLVSERNYGIADKDIICYKVFLSSPVLGLLYSPYFRHMEWIVGRQYTNKEDIDISTVNGVQTVNGGMFHSYGSYRSALMLRNKLNKHWGWPPEIYRCIIPQGTEYYIGLDVNAYTSYASRKLKVIKKLSDDNI